MDVIFLGKNSLRIKGRTSLIVVNPSSSTDKTEADAILILNRYPDYSDKKIEGFRIVITGQGEYEVSGIKISTVLINGLLVAKLDVDRIKVLVSSGQLLEKVQDKIDECDILLINADSDFNHSVVTAFEPSVVLVFGEKAEDVIKSLGKAGSEKITKFSTTPEKLPSEMQVYLLG